MAVEIPTSLIRQIQDVLRNQAGVPAHGPAGPALFGVSSFEDAISGLDPEAPPYLRCKECRAALVRGLQSTVCVYCGAEPRRDPPLSISFYATLGCRKLLQSLDLDGSEVVSLNTESKDSGKGQGIGKDGIVLSSLLDLELRWPHEGEKVQSPSTNNAPMPGTLNLSGVDLDNFFSETKRNVSSNVSGISDEILVQQKEAAPEDFGLFEELHRIDKAVDSVKTKPSVVDDASGVWKAEFQSASSQISATEPNPKDFFQDSFSSNYASAIVDEQLKTEHGMNIEGRDKVFSNNLSQILSMDDNWHLDGLWHTADSVVPGAFEQLGVKNNSGDSELKPNLVADGRAQTDLWPTSSMNILSANENIKSNDDSFDDWQGFTSSGNAPDALSNSWTNEHELGVSSVSFTDSLEDMDFGSFVQSDLLPRVPDIRKDSSKLDTIQPEASVSGRMHEWERTEINAKMWPTAEKSEMLSSRQSPGNANANVQDLLSQMHDLSFMLEDKLCIPKKVDPSD